MSSELNICFILQLNSRIINLWNILYIIIWLWFCIFKYHCLFGKPNLQSWCRGFSKTTIYVLHIDFSICPFFFGSIEFVNSIKLLKDQSYEIFVISKYITMNCIIMIKSHLVIQCSYLCNESRQISYVDTIVFLMYALHIIEKIFYVHVIIIMYPYFWKDILA